MNIGNCYPYMMNNTSNSSSSSSSNSSNSVSFIQGQMHNYHQHLTKSFTCGMNSNMAINISDTKSKILSFQELLQYKTKPCNNLNCQFYPRSSVMNNQFLEDELRCHYYHHIRDKRRHPIADLTTFTGNFCYQANYYKGGVSNMSKDKYSQNFFESLYHPLYYKRFPCKRDHCEKTKYCPYYHSAREKIEWDIIFEQNLNMNKQMFEKSKPKQIKVMNVSKLHYYYDTNNNNNLQSKSITNIYDLIPNNPLFPSSYSNSKIIASIDNQYLQPNICLKENNILLPISTNANPFMIRPYSTGNKTFSQDNYMCLLDFDYLKSPSNTKSMQAE